MIVIVLSFLDLVGWVFNITLFEKIMPQWIPMNKITAICFVMAAITLVIIMLNISGIIKKLLAFAFSFFIFSICLLTIYADIYSLQSGHESFLDNISFLNFFLPPQMRMTFITACNFILISFVLLLLSIWKTKTSDIAHFLIIPVTLISYFLPVSYILGVYSVSEMNEIAIALNADISFFAICTAVLLLRPETWLLKIFSSGESGNIIARKLIPALIIIPLVIGWLKINGERAGLFNPDEGVAIVTIIYTVCFLVLVWLTARSVNNEDRKRRLIEEALRLREIELIELNATKDKFFNIVAHDLKNPFTSLLGSSELLYSNIEKLQTENIKDLALILNDSAKSGYAILQNLLDWSRSQTGLLKINPERINLGNLINENISTLQLQAANKQIRMSYINVENIFVFADKNMINTILRNILSNAVKYTYKSGNICVTTTTGNNEVIVSVKDNGIGIPADKIDKLFKIDSKNSTPGTENEQGTGLGLKLSKEFVEKLGGRIWVESVEDKGSEFKFSIPITEF
jgi:signal transduction histidine kinase